MNGRDEQELRERIDGALAVVTPGPAPAAAVVRRGRAIRRRRHAAAAGALAVVAALAVAAPGLLRGALGAEPARTAGQLTINVLGPAARDGVIGSGRTDGKPWTVWLAGGANPVAQATGVPATAELGTMPNGSDPAAVHATGSGDRRLLAGPVSPDVTYLTMRLADGTSYRLSPVAWHGHHYVGLVVPWNLQVARFTAYSRHGELAFAIPFPAAVGLPQVVSWLRPGTAIPPVTSAPVAHGQDNRLSAGYRWDVEAQIGPWGTCLQANGGSYGLSCLPTRSYPPNTVTSAMHALLGVHAGITGRAVAYIQLRLRNGNTARLRVVHVGGQGFYALSVLADHVTSWTAYTAAGHPVASGTGPPG
jgi:hypothetical protein